jgi:hypothetical protein
MVFAKNAASGLSIRAAQSAGASERRSVSDSLDSGGRALSQEEIGAQNGLTTARTTIAIRMSVGTSLAIR